MKAYDWHEYSDDCLCIHCHCVRQNAGLISQQAYAEQGWRREQKMIEVEDSDRQILRLAPTA